MWPIKINYKTHEIGNISVDRVLAAELVSIQLSVFKNFPESNLRWCENLSQFPCSSASDG
jgi:hypothetical protein